MDSTELRALVGVMNTSYMRGPTLAAPARSTATARSTSGVKATPCGQLVGCLLLPVGRLSVGWLFVGPVFGRCLFCLSLVFYTRPLHSWNGNYEIGSWSSCQHNTVDSMYIRVRQVTE